ncbi:hypothetical protein [uncultured Clostridium sp.]|uniref:hypothetical protein n=1 Tax=uncultured Clostridium sp. TaxID=59620 RepID=UPI0025CB8ACD|nr:hypothetical protein [uncultured Clostridium sp.]
MYVYRKHLRASFLNYILGMIIFLSIGLLSGFAAILSRKAKFEMIDFFILIIVAIVIFTFILIEFILLYFLFLRRFKYINVTLEEDAIIYNNSKKKIVIPYDEIIEIKYPSIRYMGGWMKIKHTNGKIRLTVVLENIGDFMYRLKEILDEGGKSDVYNKKKSFNFFKTASFSDESWERLYDNVKYLIVMEYVSIIISIILAFFGIAKNPIFIIWGSVIGPIIGYMIIELIIIINNKKRIVKNEFKLLDRDSSKDNKRIKIAITVSTLLSIILMIFIR